MSMCIILDVLSVCQELALILVAIFVRSTDLRMEGYKFLVDKKDRIMTLTLFYTTPTSLFILDLCAPDFLSTYVTKNWLRDEHPSRRSDV